MAIFENIDMLPGQVLDRRGRRVWWTGFILITIASLLLAGIGYRHGLPFVDEADEVTDYAFAHSYVDPTWTIWQPGQPPGEFVVSSFVQRMQIALGDPWINVAGTVEILRVISVLMQTACVALTMLLARRLAGTLAGLSAGIFWMTLPLADRYSKYATQNLWVTAFFVAAMLVGVEGWYRKSLRWLALSLLLAIIATLIKWQAAACIGVPGLACLTFWRTDRRKMIAAMGAYVIVVAAFSYWVVFIHKALEGSYYFYTVPSQTPTIANILANFLYMTTVAGPGVVYALLPLVGLVLAALIRPIRRRVYSEMGLWSFIPVFIVFCIILSVYGAPVFDRQYLPAMPLLAALAGLGLSILIAICLKAFANRPQVRKLAIGALVVFIGVFVAQMTVASVNDDLIKLLPDRHNEIANWTQSTVTTDPVLILDPKLELSVEPLYGYRGPTITKPYNDVMTVYLQQNQLNADALNAQHIRYIISKTDFDPKKVNVPLTLLNSGSNDPNQIGPNWKGWYVGTLPAVSPTPLITFGGELAIRGYTLSSQSVCHGHPLALQFLWSAAKQPSRYYSIYVHFYSDQTQELGLPLNGAELTKTQRPTVTWTNPAEIIVGTPWNWAIPASVPPGNYQLWIGTFDPISGTRLKLPDGSDHYVLTDVKVRDCTGASEF